LIFGDLAPLNESKNDEKLNNSGLSPFMSNDKNSRSLSISLDKSYSLDSQNSNESFKIQVDESIKNWIDTIERLNQNSDLKNYCNSRNRSSFKTYNELKDFLKTPLAKTDFEKAWIVYFWICHNIEYDVSAFKQVKNFDIKPRSVFLQHKTVSAGYSSLFKDLCEHLDLPCYHIKGYAKGFSFENGKPLYHENHDWNRYF
jgi:transglutaminase/protease-like cytokinesis protein 3